MGSLRAWNIETDTKEGLMHKTIAIGALIASIFQHRSGMMLSSVQDLILEIRNLQKQDTWEGASKSMIKIGNHFVYLALMSRGGLELSAVSFAMQALINLIESRDEFKQDRWIEGCASLLMAGIRIKQTHAQYQQLQRNGKIEEIQGSGKEKARVVNSYSLRGESSDTFVCVLDNGTRVIYEFFQVPMHLPVGSEIFWAKEEQGIRIFYGNGTSAYFRETIIGNTYIAPSNKGV